MRFIKFCSVFLIAAFFFAEHAEAKQSPIVSVLDTVADFETVLEGQGFTAGQKVSFQLTKPDRNTAVLSAFASQDGALRLIILATHTRVAGSYMISVISKGSEGSSASFTVYPGEMSPDASAIYVINNTAAANGVDIIRVNVRITDEFGNPLPFHDVGLVSSRSSDSVSAERDTTDEKGVALFSIRSRRTGVSVLTATDETAGDSVAERTKVTFTRPTVFRAIGGDPERILLAAADSAVSSFKIENLPATVTLNETISSFTVKAVDASSNVVSSYSGTAVFSSTDSNVSLPNPYTFTATDQGRHTFTLSATFRTAGTQKLTVKDKEDASIKAEKTVEVVRKERSSAGEVKITKPATGTYSVNILEIAGEADPNETVKLFDNGQQIAEVKAASSGRFSFTTSLLADGQHTFHAESNGVVSEEVEVTIDSTAAQIEQVDIAKTNLAPSETTAITIRSDPELDSVQATLGDTIVDLEPDPDNPGIYRGILTAPDEDGEYTVNVVLTDNVGNISPTKEVGKIRVDSSLKETEEGTTTTFSVPSVVTGLTARAGNSRVTLAWNAAQAEAGIAFYRIYYGTDPLNLKLVANTKDASTTWYVPNLQNSAKYYFQVVGVDAQGVEGDNRSAIVSAIPSASLAVEESGVGTSSPVLCDPSPCPPDLPSPTAMPEDGPEVLGMILAAIVGTEAVRWFRKKRD